MEIKSFIVVDPDIQNGQPVFKGTRVPVESLFVHLEKGVSIDSFIDDFPSVSREQVLSVLALAEKLFSTGNINLKKLETKINKELSGDGSNKVVVVSA